MSTVLYIKCNNPDCPATKEVELEGEVDDALGEVWDNCIACGDIMIVHAISKYA